MTNKILTHLCLATAQDLPGRINSPALERLKMLSRGLDQKHTEEFERKVVMKHGDLRAQSGSRNFEEDCRMRVNKLWWDVRVRGNFGFHRTDMSRRVVPRQGLNELELPPLEFITRTLHEDERPSEPNFGQSQSQFLQHSQIEQAMQQPQVWQRYPLQEVQNNCEFGHPNSQMWGSKTNIQNPPSGSVFNGIPEILNPAMVWAMKHNVRHQNHAFHDFSKENIGFPMMTPGPFWGGHRRGPNGRRGNSLRSWSYEGGRKNPY